MRLTEEQVREGHAHYRGDRSQLLLMAEAGARNMERWGVDGFVRMVLHEAPDKTSSSNAITLADWHVHGLQSVEVSHKLAAALMATSAVGALDDAHLPWPCFEIRVPTGLVESSHGEVYSVIVSGSPAWLPERYKRGSAGVIVMYYDTHSIGHIGVDCLAHVARFEPSEMTIELGRMREVLREEYNAEREDRVKQLLMRLVTGVILLVTEARADKPQAFPKHPLRPAKRGELRVNTHRITRPVSIDVTATVRDFARGVGRDSPHVTTLVRGHWRQQAHGPKRSLRRTQWIEPFWRGEGPLSVRPTTIRDR